MFPLGAYKNNRRHVRVISAYAHNHIDKSAEIKEHVRRFSRAVDQRIIISEIIQNRPSLLAAVVFLFFVYVWRDLYAVPSRSSRSLRLRIASIRFECILLVSMNFYFFYSLAMFYRDMNLISTVVSVRAILRPQSACRAQTRGVLLRHR